MHHSVEGAAIAYITLFIKKQIVHCINGIYCDFKLKTIKLFTAFFIVCLFPFFQNFYLESKNVEFIT